MTATLTRQSTFASPMPAPAVRVTAERYGLTEADLVAFGEEMDAIRTEVLADLGQDDADYIRKVISVQRRLAVAGRALHFVGFFPPAWIAGTAALSVSKILDNMEIGHNILHGQYDWTNDPELTGATFDWDHSCPSDQWRHSHNHLHHTYTNIVGKDRDLGYGTLRVSADQPWHPRYLANPLVATIMALDFEHAVMFHDVEIEEIRRGRKTWADAWPTLKAGLAKSGRQGLKDYVLWPALTGPMFLSTLAGNAVANLTRNLWTFVIIFCGHFPEGVHDFTQEECEDESRGHWYFRQMLGSANIEGGPLFHVMSGNLSHQIEHHMFPDIPARRYAEMAPKVQAACESRGLPYNSGGLTRQFTSTVRKIVRLALPGG